ncbi:MAG: hypothetical protein NUV49_00165 [Patescibacteria group bacterium]|nr:hypothetical protein [Patescibacteria group bacterium]
MKSTKTAQKPFVKNEKVWFGTSPVVCDLCRASNLMSRRNFVDGKTVFGPWAIMCLECHMLVGAGIGDGRGQHYRLHDDGRWVKIGG